MRVRDLPSLGEAVRHRRQELGISQTELADSANTTRQWISRLEKGNAEVTVARLFEVVHTLGLNLDLRDPARTRSSLLPDAAITAIQSVNGISARLPDTDSFRALAEATRSSDAVSAAASRTISAIRALHSAPGENTRA